MCRLMLVAKWPQHLRTDLGAAYQLWLPIVVDRTWGCSCVSQDQALICQVLHLSYKMATIHIAGRTRRFAWSSQRGLKTDVHAPLNITRLHLALTPLNKAALTVLVSRTLFFCISRSIEILRLPIFIRKNVCPYDSIWTPQIKVWFLK